MKGTLNKHEEGWVVRYGDMQFLPLHPDFIELMETCFTSKFIQEVEFEIVTEWENGEVGVNGLSYAKLIKEEKPFIDNRKEKLETLARLLAKSWYYGDWDWENPNERVMQMIMQDLGLYPFKSEDEMIQQTRVDEDLYKEAVDKVKLRKPRLMPIETHPVDTNKMIDHIGEVNEMVEDDVVKLAEEYAIKVYHAFEDATWFRPLNLGYYAGYTKAKETLYTEEQVKELLYYFDLEIKKHLLNYRIEHSLHGKICDGINDVRNNYIQSLKK
jgi:hypothetical protein